MSDRKYRWLLEKGIIFIMPLYKIGLGDITLVGLENHKDQIIERNIRTVVNRLYRVKLIDPTASKNYYGQLLNKRKNIPLILDKANIFIMVKTRVPIGKNDGAYTYINSKYIDHYDSRSVLLKDGREIVCQSSLYTLKKLENETRFIKENFS